MGIMLRELLLVIWRSFGGSNATKSSGQRYKGEIANQFPLIALQQCSILNDK